eukprot:9872282-Ditylum_brightwellii.AAC.1
MRWQGTYCFGITGEIVQSQPATDGSAEDDIMSFAWKICSNDGKAYICHAGPAFGIELSFQAEAYGVLL